MKAFEVTALDSIYLVASSTAGRARYMSWKGAREAGYRIGFGHIQVRRSPENDEWAQMEFEGAFQMVKEAKAWWEE